MSFPKTPCTIRNNTSKDVYGYKEQIVELENVCSMEFDGLQISVDNSGNMTLRIHDQKCGFPRIEIPYEFRHPEVVRRKEDESERMFMRHRIISELSVEEAMEILKSKLNPVKNEEEE